MRLMYSRWFLFVTETSVITNATMLWVCSARLEQQCPNLRTQDLLVRLSLEICPKQNDRELLCCCPGFVNIVLSKTWIAKNIQKMLMEGIQIWALISQRRCNVGRLRSTIIGDTLAKMLEFSGVEVLRRNHVGDWGTQFGMLIEFLFEQFPQWEADNEIPIKDLEAFYKQSKERFDDVSVFKERAQKAVVSLQGGEMKV